MKKNSGKIISQQPKLPGQEENQLFVLTKAIYEGVESSIVQNFNPKKHLAALKAPKKMKG